MKQTDVLLKLYTLQPENIMFTSKKSNDVKLIDFGLATKVNPRDAVKVSTGTAEFAAPELVDRQPVGFYTDMWATGVLAYILWVCSAGFRILMESSLRLSGLSPFGGNTDEQTLRNVQSCDWSFDAEGFKTVSDEGKDFIKRLLVKEPESVF